MSDSFYIRLGLTVRGPYSVSDLHELANRGSFSKSHDVSSDKKSWTSASSHPELFPTTRQPVGLDRRQRSVDAEENDTATAAVAPRVSQRPADSDEPAVDRAVPPPVPSTNVRELSRLTIWTAVVGLAGFILLMVCTAMVVMRLRASAFTPGENIGLIAILFCDAILGGVAVTLGHLAIKKFVSIAGTIKERNLIVIGLSCGYTILILCVLYAVVLLISALS
ncbi:MAG TPA: hypothetical protein PLY87_15085 [Planctomycetaceae bacterium]|nr:hypothetical protein [Planctomycetaceae bacterium]HQZ66412.1 hypothetical protein [Planctomycetaceae bacterium]